MSKRKPNKQDLIPPDPKQCQGEKHNGYSFMTLGGVPGYVRCKNKPSVIVTEKKPNKDGYIGSMSLCNGCLSVAKMRSDVPPFTIKLINERQWHPSENRPRYHSIAGKDCEITIEQRPPYCDRGNWIAKIHARGELQRDLDSQDQWPRYYMDLERAKLEIEAWLDKRRQ